MPINMTKRKTYIGDVFSALLDRGWAIQETVDFCNRLTTIDAVEVVRCKDCRRRYDADECPMCFLIDGEHYEYTNGNGFCDRGERRDTDV